MQNLHKIQYKAYSDRILSILWAHSDGMMTYGDPEKVFIKDNKIYFNNTNAMMCLNGTHENEWVEKGRPNWNHAIFEVVNR